MKKPRYTEQQIAQALRQTEQGTPAAEVCRAGARRADEMQSGDRLLSVAVPRRDPAPDAVAGAGGRPAALRRPALAHPAPPRRLADQCQEDRPALPRGGAGGAGQTAEETGQSAPGAPGGAHAAE